MQVRFFFEAHRFSLNNITHKTHEDSAILGLQSSIQIMFLYLQVLCGA